MSEHLPCPFCGMTLVDNECGSYYHQLPDRNYACIFEGITFRYSRINEWNTRTHTPTALCDEPQAQEQCGVDIKWPRPQDEDDSTTTPAPLLVKVREDAEQLIKTIDFYATTPSILWHLHPDVAALRKALIDAKLRVSNQSKKQHLKDIL